MSNIALDSVGLVKYFGGRAWGVERVDTGNDENSSPQVVRTKFFFSRVSIRLSCYGMNQFRSWNLSQIRPFCLLEFKLDGKSNPGQTMK